MMGAVGVGVVVGGGVPCVEAWSLFLMALVSLSGSEIPVPFVGASCPSCTLLAPCAPLCVPIAACSVCVPHTSPSYHAL